MCYGWNYACRTYGCKKLINKMENWSFFTGTMVFLTPGIWKMPSNALVYPQNKCICFSLQIGTMHHISEEKINTINCWSNSTPKLNRHSFFEYVNNMCPYYMKEVIEYASQVRLGWTNHYAQNGAKRLSYICSPKWSKSTISKKRNI